MKTNSLIHKCVVSEDNDDILKRKQEREKKKERLVGYIKQAKMDGITAEKLSKQENVDLYTASQYLRDLHRDGDWGVHRRKVSLTKNGKNHVFSYFIPPSLPTTLLSKADKEKIRKSNELRRIASARRYEELSARYKERYGELP